MSWLLQDSQFLPDTRYCCSVPKSAASGATVLDSSEFGASIDFPVGAKACRTIALAVRC